MQDLSNPAQSFGLIDLFFFFQHGRQIPPLQVLHGNPLWTIAAFPGVEYLDDVGVLNGSNSQCFSLKPCCGHRAGAGSHAFQSHLTTKALVNSAVDAGHGSSTEEFADAVVPESVPLFAWGDRKLAGARS